MNPSTSFSIFLPNCSYSTTPFSSLTNQRYFFTKSLFPKFSFFLHAVNRSRLSFSYVFFLFPSFSTICVILV
ncbi:hypothetical protein Syun_000768 [Stephania yunnanensis]|uniref:Uncharacterized protein n=1 Tax=Stephania yunnanensis TaxID=152371 RepID=A0AAP0LCK0_9MAGN